MSGEAVVSPPSTPAEPIGSYRLLSVLGASPTGMSYLAERSDGLYEKRVVVKLASEAGADGLYREREALATLDHPNVARLLDGGSSANGRPFLVMEHVEGPPLDRFCEQAGLPASDRLALFRQVCDAVHLAHQNLVLHGDLRADTVRVTADGMPKVVFFGPAPSIFAERREATTSVDVQALGALLRAVLRGAPPDATGDLDAIVRSSLDPEASGGYRSALVLGQEIGRHLAGEPILTRAGSLPYRLGTWLRKRRLQAILTAASVAVALALCVFLALRHRDARRRLELAQAFGREGAEIAAVAYAARLLPLHPTGYVRDEVRRRMAAIEHEVRRLGELAEGPASYALGRGCLALADYECARDHLERAWNGGFRSSEAAFSLGVALGALYAAALDESERLDAPSERSAARRHAAATYRDPALRFFRSSRRGDGETAAHAEGMIHLLDGRLDDALASAREAAAKAPWLSEARLLEATALVEKGSGEERHGRFAEARTFFEQAGDAYAAALAIARSDAYLYAGECGRRSRLVRLDHQLGTLEAATVEEAVRPCELALLVDPGCLDARAHAARIRWRWADRQLRRGEDPTASLDVVQRLATEILELEPRSAAGLRIRGDAFSALAKWQGEHGKEPWLALDGADEAYRAATALRPADSELHNARGSALTARARFTRSRGEDPRPALREAVASYRLAVDLDSDYAAAQTNLGTVHLELARAEMADGGPGEPTIRAGIPSLERAVELGPGVASGHQNLGAAYLALAQDRLQRRLDPSESLATAGRHFRRAVALDPGYFIARHNLAVTAQMQGAYRLVEGLDPHAALEESIVAFDEAMRLRPAVAAVSEAAKALSELMLARWAVESGGDPGPRLAAAASACDRAQAGNPLLADAQAARAELHLLKARRARSGSAERRSLVESGLTAARRSLELDPGNARTRGLEGAILLLAAEGANGERQRLLAEQAAERLGFVLVSNAVWDAETFRALLEQARSLTGPAASTRS